MEVFFAALLLVGFCVVGLCFNIIFRKGGKFPETEISSNRNMKKLGIKCAKEDEMKLWGRKNGKANPTCADLGCGDCAGCGFIEKEEEKK